MVPKACAGDQHEYDRVPRSNSENEGSSGLDERPRDRTGTEGSLMEDDFVEHPAAHVHALDYARSDTLNTTEEKRTQGDGTRVEIGSLPLFVRRHPHAWSTIKRALTTNLVKDEDLMQLYRYLCRTRDDVDIDDGGMALVKLFKFLVLSILGIMIVHPLVRWMDWEVDPNFTIRDFLQYDFTTVLLDLLFFFVVGRLHSDSCCGIDAIFPWGFFITVGAIYPSITSDIEFMKHSVSMYEIMCRWPTLLFIYAFVLVAGAVIFIWVLMRSHHRRKVLISRIFEATTLLCLFILPFATDNSFHLHHWYAMWLIGMQSNAPEWWARAFQAYCLGSYLNGIAVYGRDPVLGCEYAFYRSTDISCEFMQCFKKEVPSNQTETEYKAFVPSDWRTCNSVNEV
ncbi:hypothetical protein ACHAWF_015330 [Thalassiosira exigua]